MTYGNDTTADAIFEGGPRRPVLDDSKRALKESTIGLLQRWKAHREQKRAIQALRQLSSHTLRDIGMDRSEIVSAVVHGRTKRRR